MDTNNELRQIVSGERRDTDAQVTAAAIDLAKTDGDWEAVERLTAEFHARRTAAAVAGTPLCERIGK